MQSMHRIFAIFEICVFKIHILQLYILISLQMIEVKNLNYFIGKW